MGAPLGREAQLWLRDTGRTVMGPALSSRDTSRTVMGPGLLL